MTEQSTEQEALREPPQIGITCMKCRGRFIIRDGEIWCPRCDRCLGDGFGGVS